MLPGQPRCAQLAGEHEVIRRPEQHPSTATPATTPAVAAPGTEEYGLIQRGVAVGGGRLVAAIGTIDPGKRTGVGAKARSGGIERAGNLNVPGAHRERTVDCAIEQGHED